MSNYQIVMEFDNDGYDMQAELIIKYNGEVIARYWDGGEPEDNSFSRDWSWIDGELERAYNLGYKDGAQSVKNIVQ